jgi:hypothetical protein
MFSSEYPSVHAYWDDQTGVEPGWYYDVRNEEGEVIDDSMKAWCPIDLDLYEKKDGEALIEALSVVYEDHEIYLDPPFVYDPVTFS